MYICQICVLLLYRLEVICRLRFFPLFLLFHHEADTVRLKGVIFFMALFFYLHLTAHNFMEIIEEGWIVPGFATMAVSLLLVVTKRWHGKHSLDTMVGVQKFHTSPTPRIGGVAIFAGLLVAWFFSPEESRQLLGPMLIAGFPAFAVGVAEDLTKRVGVRERLFATMLSGLTAWWLTGYSINHIEIGILATLFAWLPFSVAFTAFAVAGVANSVNIIDGFNGLAAGTLMICFSALSLIAWLAGDLQLARLSFILLVITGGFMVINFPFGKLFLGDGGAYLLGFLMAWVAVMLPMRNPSVSVWAPLLVCGYPVMETLFSMGRRLWSRANPGHPDTSHVHSLIKLNIVRPNFGYLPGILRNSLVSPFCWAFALIPAFLSVVFYDRTDILAAAWLGCFVLYSLIYLYLAKKNKKAVKPFTESFKEGDLAARYSN